VDADERRRLELKAVALMSARIEALLFSAPAAAFACAALDADPPEPPVFLFYRCKS